MKARLLVLAMLGVSLTAMAQKQNIKNPSGHIDNGTFRSSNNGSLADNSKPEPSGVYGYVSVVDPGTGMRYVADPRATPSERGSGLSFPMYVVFRATNNPSQTTRLQYPAGMTYYRNPPVAVWYSYSFAQDAAAGNNPFFNYRDSKIHYDPSKWRFLRVESDGIGWQEMSDRGVTTPVQVPVSPVPPIAELPDFHGDVYGPR